MTDIRDFIGVFDGAIPDELCDRLIKTHADAAAIGMVKNRQQEVRGDGTILSSLYVDDEFCHLNEWEQGLEIAREVSSIFWSGGYVAYANKYSILASLERHVIKSMKLQKTSIGGGYHVWHTEVDNAESGRRLLVFSIYLNDVEEGGETEFLYQHRRVAAKKGRLVIWPAGYTHTHRGNPPLTGEKYILTGWVEFLEPAEKQT